MIDEFNFINKGTDHITIKLRKANTPKQKNVHFFVLGPYKILKLMAIHSKVPFISLMLC